MATAALEAGRFPHSQTGRTATARPVQIFDNNSSDTANSANTLRVQRLRLIGIIGQRAELLARLAWGEVQHD